MNEREMLLVRAVAERLAAFTGPLVDEGWRPEIIVFGPSEIDRLAGYKVALVVPLGPLPADDGGAREEVAA